MDRVTASLSSDPLLASGRVLDIGKSRVIPERYLSEGSFARVYLGRDITFNRAVAFKHIQTANRDHVQTAKKEVALMSKMKHKNIVQFYDAEIQPLPSTRGGCEIFISMEFCPGGHVVGLMNKRIHDRFREPEILRIFGDVCEAVAYLHYQSPPIIHRDLKVENVLIGADGNYKLCDFGSCSSRTVPAGYLLKGPELEEWKEDIERETTLQYRAPELCDLVRKRGIDEKVDIWALGVLLYKLCYFTTPFENEGQFAILNCRYDIPSTPAYSNALIALIKNMLCELPENRFNIYQVLRSVCDLRRIPCPIQNMYTEVAARDEKPLPAEPKGQVILQAGPKGFAVPVIKPNLLHVYMPDAEVPADTSAPPPGVRRGRSVYRSKNAVPVGQLFHSVIDKAADVFSNEGQGGLGSMSLTSPPILDSQQGPRTRSATAPPTSVSFFDNPDAFTNANVSSADPKTSFFDEPTGLTASSMVPPPAEDFFTNVPAASSKSTAAEPDDFFASTAASASAPPASVAAGGSFFEMGTTPAVAVVPGTANNPALLDFDSPPMESLQRAFVPAELKSDGADTLGASMQSPSKSQQQSSAFGNLLDGWQNQGTSPSPVPFSSTAGSIQKEILSLMNVSSSGVSGTGNLGLALNASPHRGPMVVNSPSFPQSPLTLMTQRGSVNSYSAPNFNPRPPNSPKTEQTFNRIGGGNLGRSPLQQSPQSYPQQQLPTRPTTVPGAMQSASHHGFGYGTATAPQYQTQPATLASTSPQRGMYRPHSPARGVNYNVSMTDRGAASSIGGFSPNRQQQQAPSGPTDVFAEFSSSLKTSKRRS